MFLNFLHNVMESNNEIINEEPKVKNALNRKRNVKPDTDIYL